MWNNILEPDRPQMIIWRKRIARCVPTATNTDSDYVIHVLTAFPRLQWLHERASMLRYMYIVCLVNQINNFGASDWIISQRQPIFTKLSLWFSTQNAGESGVLDLWKRLVRENTRSLSHTSQPIIVNTAVAHRVSDIHHLHFSLRDMKCKSSCKIDCFQ
jgi:hypothetical protein